MFAAAGLGILGTVVVILLIIALFMFILGRR